MTQIDTEAKAFHLKNLRCLRIKCFSVSPHIEGWNDLVICQICITLTPKALAALTMLVSELTSPSPLFLATAI